MFFSVVWIAVVWIAVVFVVVVVVVACLFVRLVGWLIVVVVNSNCGCCCQ